MASFVFNDFKAKVYSGAVKLSDYSNYKLALIGSYTPSNTITDVNQILTGNQITIGGGYVGPVKLNAARAVAYNDGKRIIADDIVWNNSSIAANGAFIYIERGSELIVVSYIDFGNQITSVNGTFAVALATNGFLQTP